MTVAPRSSAPHSSAPRASEPGQPAAGAPASGASAPTFLTQGEVAALLRIPPRTLEDWRLTRTGPPFLKLGRHVRYELTEVLSWARNRRG